MAVIAIFKKNPNRAWYPIEALIIKFVRRMYTLSPGI